MGVLNLNSQIIWVLIDLLILFLLMRKFLFGPITRLLDERAKKVSDTLDQADSRLAEAEADLAYSRRLEEAEQAVQRLNEQAARQREADRAAMLAEAKQEIAALVMLTTAKVSQRTLNGETDQALLNQLLDEAGDGV